MATSNPVGTTDRDPAAVAAEAGKLKEVQDLLQALDIMQTTFAGLANPEEKQAAEGRKCILHITGLKYHEVKFFFAVEGFQIHQVDAFAKYNTYIGAPLDSVVRVLNGTIHGDESCFSREWSRGEARIVGDYSVHDGLQFREAFKRIARLIGRYRRAMEQQALEQKAREEAAAREAFRGQLHP